MERKYRQRGYMESDRGGDRGERGEQRPVKREERFGPKTPRLAGEREVVRCASCAAVLPSGTDFTGQCANCGAELHSCKQCAFFDTASRFECAQPIPARLARKDTRNQCTFYAPRATIERETSSARPLDARQAFENLFRK